jgi:hypothetical protein
VTRHDKETVCRPVDLSELVKRKSGPSSCMTCRHTRK